MTAISELAVLAGLLIHPDRIAAHADLRPEHFERAEYGRYYRIMLQQVQTGVVPDAATVYLSSGSEQWAMSVAREIADPAAYSGNVDRHVRAVIDGAIRRRIIAAAREIASLADSDRPIATVSSDAIEALQRATDGVVATGPRHLDDVVGEVVASAGSESSQRAMVATGIVGVDATTGGLPRGLVTILAARPSMGKSCVALNMVANMAQRGARCLLCSLEDTAHHVGSRMLARATGRDVGPISRGADGDVAALAAGAESLRGLPVWIDDRPGRDVAAIRYLATLHRQQHGLDVLIVDHAGELTDDAHAYASASANMRKIRDIAKELDCAALVLNQMNRQAAGREDKRPVLTDLRDSGKIEEIARNIWFLYRPAYYDQSADRTLLEIIVAKASHGRTGTIRCRIDLQKMEVQ